MLKVQELREIIRLIDSSSINEFTYEANGIKVKIKKDNDKGSNPLTEQTVRQPVVTEQPGMYLVC